MTSTSTAVLQYVQTSLGLDTYNNDS